MGIPWNLAALLPSIVQLVCPLRGDDPKPSANVNTYLYATTTCIGGEGGPGVRVVLKQFRQCQGRTTYPYLRIDIREQPILAQRNIAIVGDNSAFRCLGARQSCDEAISGNILFDHFEELSGKEIRTDGYYELKFKNGKAEGGLFKVDCMAPCS